MTENSWHSYPKVWGLGHANIGELFFDDVIVEEKLDGSQFSFCMLNGELLCRSRGKQLILDAPEKMFIAAIDVVKGLRDKLHDGWTYRAEYLMSPKHNVLCYERIPANHLIIFDINTGYEHYLPYQEKKEEAERLGLECVPLLYEGKVKSADDLVKFLELDSILGKCKIEGVVCKNYKRFGRDGKALLGKHVSEKFKEKHNKDWKIANPSGKDIVQSIGQDLRTDARWEKAIQHLREAGQIENSPKDIGPLMKEIHLDLEGECGDEIKEKLYKWSLPKVKRIVAAGFPEWYKDKLMKSQFGEGGG